MKILALSVLLLAPTSVLAQETAVPKTPVTVTVPVTTQTQVTITGWQVIGFSQDRLPDWRFTITWRDNTGKIYTDSHSGVVSVVGPNGADTFLKQMNTTNFSTVSMIRRLFQHLEAHGKIPPHTIQGTPEASIAVPIGDIVLRAEDTLGIPGKILIGETPEWWLEKKDLVIQIDSLGQRINDGVQYRIVTEWWNGKEWVK